MVDTVMEWGTVWLCFGTLVTMILFLAWRVQQLQQQVKVLQQQLDSMQYDLEKARSDNVRFLERLMGDHK